MKKVTKNYGIALRASALVIPLAVIAIPLMLRAQVGSSTPTSCNCPMNYSPVCGLDGKTYGNECMAKCANVGVAKTGECIVPEKECWDTSVTKQYSGSVYLSTDDNPFKSTQFKYFQLEDFEDQLFNTKGASISGPWQHGVSVTLGAGVTTVDSVDKDDGVIDTYCLKKDPKVPSVYRPCGSYWVSAATAKDGLTITFDKKVLGTLPTHFGVVWVDGGYKSSFSLVGYDSNNKVIASRTIPSIGDGTVNPLQSKAKDEDRFLGFTAVDGIQKVVLTASNTFELDHVQWGLAEKCPVLSL